MPVNNRAKDTGLSFDEDLDDLINDISSPNKKVA
jgi:hypothetical protein